MGTTTATKTAYHGFAGPPSRDTAGPRSAEALDGARLTPEVQAADRRNVRHGVARGADADARRRVLLYRAWSCLLWRVEFPTRLLSEEQQKQRHEMLREVLLAVREGT